MNHAEHRTIVKLKTLQPQNPRLLGELKKNWNKKNPVSILPNPKKEISVNFNRFPSTPAPSPQPPPGRLNGPLHAANVHLTEDAQRGAADHAQLGVRQVLLQGGHQQRQTTGLEHQGRLINSWHLPGLVNIQKTMEKHHAINGKNHYFYSHFQ